MKTSRRFLSVVLLLGCITAGLGVPPAAAALKSWTGKVTYVSDGDTFDIDVPNDGKGAYTIRLIGINTPEGRLKSGVFVGQCNGKAARDLLVKYIGGRRVAIKAESYNSTGSSGRKLRFVHTLHLDNDIDVNALLLRKGLAVPYPSDIEPSRNEYYIKLARLAKIDKLGIWDPKGCPLRGGEAYESGSLDVRLRWDANGSDETNLNQEYVRIENPGVTDVSLKGWVLRDSAAAYYYFAPDVVVPAGDFITVHTGSGTDSGKHYYWGRRSSLFGNEATCIDRMGIRCGPVVGDGAYLYDQHWNLRASMSYPCVVSCVHPMSKKVNIVRVAQSGDERVFIKNVTLSPVDLGGYMLDSKPWNYEIPRGTSIPAGEILRVHTGAGVDGPLDLYWNNGNSIFGIVDDYVELRRMEGNVIDRMAW